MNASEDSAMRRGSDRRPFPGWSPASTRSTVGRLGQRLPELAYLQPILPFRGDQDFRIPPAQALIDRLRTEGRKKRAEDARVFESPQGGDIKLRNAVCQNGDRVPLSQSKSFENIGKAVALSFQIAIGEVPNAAIVSEPSQGDVVAQRPLRMTIDGFVSDIEPLAPGKAVQLTADVLPGEIGNCVVIIQEVRSYRP